MWLWFKRRAVPKTQLRVEPNIKFLCEQDGTPERDLKAAIVGRLEQFREVRKAYLARVDFGDSSAYDVALCLAAPEDRQLVQAIAAIFHEKFADSQFLDILFLNSEQESDLARVCRPFYSASQ